jgi:anti-sigma B factor antagonist
MSIRIVRRALGDITILDCIGRISLGEGSSTFREAIRDLVCSGRKKIILNYSGVTHQDSSGNGELVSAFTTVANRGGSLVVLNLTKRVQDLLKMTKLYTMFEVFEDEARAIRYLESCPLHCLCPICGALSSPPLLDASSWLPQTCRDSNCGAWFTLGPDARNPAVDLIERAQITTYPDEYFEIVGGAPFKIIIAGRLNLFTSPGLSKLWRALPARIALFDLHLVTEITPEGRDVLLRLIAQPGKDEGAAISIQGLAPNWAQVLLSSPRVYPDDAAAFAALGRLLPEIPCWTARFQ